MTHPTVGNIKQAAGTLCHWSSLLSVIAVGPVAHGLASTKAPDPTGIVFAASFAVFALVLPAVGILREYADRKQGRVQEFAAQGKSAAVDALRAQHELFGRLVKTVDPLQRGVALTMMAAVFASSAIVAPSVVVWHTAPAFLTFSLSQFLTAMALILLIGVVAAMFPFTWDLLVNSTHLKGIQGAIQAGIDAANTVPDPAATKVEP